MGADTREHAKNAFERFCATWEAKYPKAADCLAGDREELLAFYDFPAAHWRSLRTTNPIESTFATIRLRNCLSEKSALSLVHQLALSAEKRWRRQRGFHHLADVITDVRFINGVNEKERAGRPPGRRRTPCRSRRKWRDMSGLRLRGSTHERVDHDRRARGEPS